MTRPGRPRPQSLPCPPTYLFVPSISRLEPKLTARRPGNLAATCAGLKTCCPGLLALALQTTHLDCPSLSPNPAQTRLRRPLHPKQRLNLGSLSANVLHPSPREPTPARMNQGMPANMLRPTSKEKAYWFPGSLFGICLREKGTSVTILPHPPPLPHLRKLRMSQLKRHLHLRQPSAGTLHLHPASAILKRTSRLILNRSANRKRSLIYWNRNGTISMLTIGSIQRTFPST